jgi:N-acetylneuraminic acid mutarotase
MVTARHGHSATLLLDGTVLVAGGRDNDGGLLASAELYDPGTGSWTTTGSLYEARTGHSATLLPDGKVLVAGGMNDEPNVNHPSLASAELYDPGTGSWTTTGSMGTRRAGGPATLLPDGKVLLVGGDDYGSDTLASAELYDPGTGTWAGTGSMYEVRAGHSATLLRDGRVLVAGGVDTVVYAGAVASAELYDPSTGSWTTAGSMVTPRRGHSATLLPDGSVLVAGGTDGTSAELYDPGTGAWTATASMVGGGFSAVLLRDGRVLVVGGGDSSAEAELYDPGSGTPPTSPATPAPSPSMSPTLVACGDPGTPAGPAIGAPGWALTGNMVAARSQHTATLLRDGRVLVEGGDAPRRVGLSLTPAVSAELYDPVTRTWTATGNLTTARGGQTATQLPDGKVLVAGGSAPLIDELMTSAELYDPGGGTWTATGNMVTGRKYHTATLLPDGRVLVAGGFGNGPNLDVLAAAELYDPRTGTWTATGSTVTPRVYHKAALLADGRVLLISGINSGPEGGPTVADLYDPRSGTWTTTRKMFSPGQGDSATLLPDGKVLVVGGSSGTFAQLFDPRSGSWTRTGSMVTPRRYHTATLRSDGTVLVTGGEFETTPTCTSAELYDPGSGSWTTVPNMLALRSNYTATLLADGNVLVAGGYDGTDGLASAELYDPGTH